MEATANGHAPPHKKMEEVLTGEPLTQGYKPTLPLWSLEATGWVPQVYLLRDIELMLIHPKVRSVLEYFKGGISGVEFDIDCKSSEVGEFILDQCQRWWDRGVPWIQGGYDYGWIGLEAMYTTEDGPLAWDCLLQFSPRDTFVLTVDQKPVGVRVKNVLNKGNVDLWMATDDVPAKGIWYPHNPRYNRLYGQSQLLGAWRPWRRLAWKDAAEMVLDMGVYRFSYTGPVIRYPEEDLQVATNVPATMLDSQNRPRRPARDVARQIGEWAKAGAAVGFPSTQYPPELGGGPKWQMEWPAHVLNVDPIVNYCLYLEKQISYGIGVPPELLEASETGSGYSGRAIPMEAFLAIQQKIADAILCIFLEEVLKPLVRWNWGPEMKFDAKVKSLLQTKRQQQAGQSGEQAPGQDVMHGRPGKGPAARQLAPQHQPAQPAMRQPAVPRPAGAQPAGKPPPAAKLSLAEQAVENARELAAKILAA